jgi:hypothetical protein
LQDGRFKVTDSEFFKQEYDKAAEVICAEWKNVLSLHPDDARHVEACQKSLADMLPLGEGQHPLARVVARAALAFTDVDNYRKFYRGFVEWKGETWPGRHAPGYDADDDSRGVLEYYTRAHFANVLRLWDAATGGRRVASISAQAHLLSPITRIHIVKLTHRIRFENEDENGVDVVIEQIPFRPGVAP